LIPDKAKDLSEMGEAVESNAIAVLSNKLF